MAPLGIAKCLLRKGKNKEVIEMLRKADGYIWFDLENGVIIS